MSVPISNVTRRVVFAPSGVGPYSFTFEILAATDIEVYKGDNLLTLTTDYTVTINANGTGSVTLVLTAGTDNITIVGARAIQRTTDFNTGGDFFANTLNDELDSLTIFAQQNAEAVNRALQAPQTDPTTIDMTLPRAADRADKFLAFDSNGNPVPGAVPDEITAVLAIEDELIAVEAIDAEIVALAAVTGNIETLAPIAANITTVAGISSSVTTVAGLDTEIAAVAANEGNIDIVAGLNTEIAALGPIASSIQAVGNFDSATLVAVGNLEAELITVSGIAGNIETLAPISADITTVAGIDGDVTTVAGIAANVTTVAGVSADVTTVAGIGSAALATVGNIDSEIVTVAGIANDVTTVAGISAAVSAVGNIDAADLAAVGNIDSEVVTVAGIAANVTTVAGISADVTTVATNVADITNFSDVYLGPAASDPATRNDSSALQEGDLYFNTVDDAIKVYTGAAWTVAYVPDSGFLVSANNLSDLTNAATARQNLDLEVGVDVQAFDADTAKLDVTQTFTAQQTFVSPILGTPASGNLENCTNLPISTGVSGLGTGVATLLGTPSSANLASALTDETGTGVAVFGTNPTLTGATMAGELACADQIVSRPTLKDYAIEGQAVGNTGATRTLDLNDANFFSATLDQACTFTFSDPPASGDFGVFVLELTNGGAFVITWPASVDWPGGTAPTLTASGVDQLVFTTRDAGTTYFGFVAGLDIKSP